MKKLCGVMLGVFALSGCVRYSSHGEAPYLLSQNAPKLVVPAPLTNEHISSFYDLPSQNEDPRVSELPPMGGYEELDT